MPKHANLPMRYLTPCPSLQSGRIRPSLDFASVMVRMMCATRAGQLEVPAWGQPLEQLRLPRYAAVGLGAKHVAEMRKVMKNKTYSQVRRRGWLHDWLHGWLV